MKKSILSSKMLLVSGLLLLAMKCKYPANEKKQLKTTKKTTNKPKVLLQGVGKSIDEEKKPSQANKNNTESLNNKQGMNKDTEWLKDNINEIGSSIKPILDNIKQQEVDKSINATSNTISVFNQETNKNNQVGQLSPTVIKFFNTAKSLNKILMPKINELHENRNIDNMHGEVDHMLNMANQIEKGNIQPPEQHKAKIVSLLHEGAKQLREGLKIVKKIDELFKSNLDKKEEIIPELRKQLAKLLALHEKCEKVKNSLYSLCGEKPDPTLAPAITDLLTKLNNINKNIESSNNMKILHEQLSRLNQIYNECAEKFEYLNSKDIVFGKNQIETYFLTLEILYAYFDGVILVDKAMKKMTNQISEDTKNKAINWK